MAKPHHKPLTVQAPLIDRRESAKFAGLAGLAHKGLPFQRAPAHNPNLMQIHASCAAREGQGVLLLGPSGSGKSDLLLRLLDRGFALVADDRVDLTGGVASAPPVLAGLLEVRGLGVVRLPHLPSAPLALAVELGTGERLPRPAVHAGTGLPLVRIDPASPSAAQRVVLALDCALGRADHVVGAFA